MKKHLLLTVLVLSGLTITVTAQQKDPMKGMDMSHMNHTAPPKKTAAAKKKITAKKRVAKKTVEKKTKAKKTIAKKKPPVKTTAKSKTKTLIAPKKSPAGMDHSMHDMDMKGNKTKPATTPMHDRGNMGQMDMTKQKTNSDTMPMHNMQHSGNAPANHDTMHMDGGAMDHMNMNNKGGHDSMNMQGGHDMKMTGMDMNDMGSMSHAYSLNLPMNRNGSGTGWLPDESPMYGHMIHSKKWMYMLHGSVWLRYNDQDYNHKGARGDSRFDAPSWFMFMAQRKLGQHGLFHFSSMFSLDPVIEGGKGYPLLFQTGESYQGKSLVDRQHPHDLFSELAVGYSYAFSKNTDAFIYIGYPGEPALGPVTFMHRPSSLDNPNSPISHHWVDATHITFGVATIGVRLGKFKAEGSAFTGREPDENRYNFDKPRFDSWSGRLSFNPNKNWTLQVSHGYVKSPEELHHAENIYKTTASVIYSIDLGNEHGIDATALWGMNKQEGDEGENALLFEAALRQRRNALYTRYEWTQKSAEELVLEPLFNSHTVFPVHAFTIGDNYDLFSLGKIRVAGGGQWSIYNAPSSLNAIYGKNPMAFQVYIRLYPSLMKM
ncbi:MAG: hypothetical protein JWN76_2387 [Chitinophagaceae bacterium]|nr:hypothetical protein [Chitinophagaceae bacterium]